MYKTHTYFSLLSEYGTSEIPLEDVCVKYFNLELQQARAKAARQELPVPSYKGRRTKKGIWLINAEDLALHLDSERAAARREWEQKNATSHPSP